MRDFFGILGVKLGYFEAKSKKNQKKSLLGVAFFLKWCIIIAKQQEQQKMPKKRAESEFEKWIKNKRR